VNNKKYRMADNKIPQPIVGTANPHQHNVVNVNELETLFYNLKVDIPIFYRDHTKGSVTAKFMFDQNKIAQTT
jgi:hypothetical protein